MTQEWTYKTLGLILYDFSTVMYIYDSISLHDSRVSLLLWSIELLDSGTYFWTDHRNIEYQTSELEKTIELSDIGLKT